MSVNGYDGQNLIEYAGRTAVDPVPTENSVRPVSSNGVFEALEGKADDFLDLGAYASYSDDTAFVTAITNHIKEMFSDEPADSSIMKNVLFHRNLEYVGTMDYVKSDNGFISILVHTYKSGLTIHFGIKNGNVFYDKIEGSYVKSGAISMTYDSVFAKHRGSIDISDAIDGGWRPKSVSCYSGLGAVPLALYSIDYNGKTVNLITVNETTSGQSVSASYLIDFFKPY